MDFGDWLRDERKKRGLTSQELAEKIGLSPSKMSRIENEKANPTFQVAIEICNALGVEIDRLLTELSDGSYVPPSTSTKLQNLPVLSGPFAQRYLTAALQSDPSYLFEKLADFWTQTERISHQNWNIGMSISPEFVEGYFKKETRTYQILSKYPLKGFDPSVIERIHVSGGLVTLEEAGRYIGGRPFTLASNAQNRVGLSRIFREMKMGRYTVLELSDALEIESKVKGGAKYFWQMYWNTIEFQQWMKRFDDKQRAERLFSLLITLCRWQQSANLDDPKWLIELEKDVEFFESMLT